MFIDNWNPINSEVMIKWLKIVIFQDSGWGGGGWGGGGGREEKRKEMWKRKKERKKNEMETYMLERVKLSIYNAQF